MKHPFRCQILPYFTMGAGGIGLALRLWLFSAVDEKGLLPAKHPAGSALFLLSALVLGILFLATRQPEVRPFRKNSLRLLNTAAYVLGGIGLILNAAVVLPASSAKLALPAMGLCLFGGLVMLFMAFLTFRMILSFIILCILSSTKSGIEAFICIDSLITFVNDG